MRLSILSTVVPAAAAALSLTAPAAAQSLTGNVGSAGVTKGEQSIETRLGLGEGGVAGSRIHVDNASSAFTDWYQTGSNGARRVRTTPGRVWFQGRL